MPTHTRDGGAGSPAPDGARDDNFAESSIIVVDDPRAERVTALEDVLAPLLNMVMVPLMLLSGIMLPMTLGPQWLQDAAKVTPFGYIITAMRDVFAGHYFNGAVAEGIAVSVGLAMVCVWLASRAFVKENA